MQKFSEFINEKKYQEFDMSDEPEFWERFKKCIKDKDWYELIQKKDKVIIKYDFQEIGEYNIKKNILYTNDTSYFTLESNCWK